MNFIEGPWSARDMMTIDWVNSAASPAFMLS
ncbi:hypothetical protein BPC006_II0154 [Burkholderia pseudomallei BPC006]|uniref:Uncharacterized protein n=1 Tax=Burkholderia pseudomallei (strain 1710b) TaxID=320372 RepID=Q3JI17_BURP1|nr:hypothetical protein BURPS1710b_A1629 [Burkholderia pseudomallei 1710b]AFR18093.1 hypothetical protein BPC006_II0154 [Burkholderia pseudomallei BPC006]EDO92964.1 hypothetical protein BURPSPAST_E0307 [Burkholderia pseudomallei Pasteur 52237]EDS84885.1 hypothetical protein BURPSS13_J0075 [Burkholderia pseudomallei S13]